MTYIDSVSSQDQDRDIKNIVNNTVFYFAEIPRYGNKQYQCCCVDCNRSATHHHKSIQIHIIGSYCDYCKKGLEAGCLDDLDKFFKKITIKQGKLKKMISKGWYDFLFFRSVIHYPYLDKIYKPNVQWSPKYDQ
jgi:hypothetical protein